MPPKSRAFLRIRSEVMAIARAIPLGRVTTFAAIGRYLDVVPRQVAYLLARRDDEEREAAPWYRVVGEGGILGKPKSRSFGQSQAELLRAEGIAVSPDGRIERFEDLFLSVTLETTGIVPGPRGSGPS
jgi:methylated-DNA-protein-cysteine methyltransferase-like protein